MGTQLEAIEAIKSGENVSLSGGAGRGKSWVIGEILNSSTILTAPTGIASLNIEGDTCHSCFGLPFGMPTEKDSAYLSDSFRELFAGDDIKTIVIDEKSILRADHFDLIDKKLRMVKRSSKPFGGLQMIIVGDLWQLPPIVSNNEKRFFRRLYKSSFIFSSKVYKKANFKEVILDKPYRQEDIYQVALLDRIRSKSNGWENAIKEINRLCSAKAKDDTLNLCVFNADADKINEIHYKRNTNKVVTYTAKVKGAFRDTDCLVSRCIRLKQGIRVIICANCKEKTYRNGEMGTVVELNEDNVLVLLDTGTVVTVTPHKWESVKYMNGITGLGKVVTGNSEQMPLRIGNAISIHKSQSLTLDNVVINMGSGAFGPALAYVALSRVRDLRNISLTRPIEEKDIIVDRDVVKYHNEILKLQEQEYETKRL